MRTYKDSSCVCLESKVIYSLFYISRYSSYFEKYKRDTDTVKRITLCIKRK